MHATKLQKASSAADAAGMLAADDEAKVLAGGQTLTPTMKQRLAAPSALVSLAGAGLSGISTEGDMLVIGAMTSHAEVAGSATVRAHCPALAALAGGIGDPAVRHRGTIGGSLANNDPAADYPSAVLGLGATVVTNSREISAEDYFAGMFETALEEGEVITAVKFPKANRAGYAKFPNPASRYAMVGVFVADFGKRGVRVGVTGAKGSAYSEKAMEKALSADFSANALAKVKVKADDMNEDIHGSAEYRAHLVGVMVNRAVNAAK